MFDVQTITLCTQITVSSFISPNLLDADHLFHFIPSLFSLFHRTSVPSSSPLYVLTIPLFVTSIDEIDAWYERTFAGLTPLKVITHPMTENITFDKIENRPIVPGCIMDMEWYKMKIPLLGENPDKMIEDFAETVLSLTIKEAGERKSVCGILRGMGGGKTRALEETRRVLLLKKGVFVLAVTYNSKWSVGGLYDQWGSDNAPISYALSLISRMASVFYGITFEKAYGMMKKHDSSFPEAELFDAQYLIRSFVNHMADDIHASNKNRQIDKFVLIIDEAFRMEKYIHTTFKATDITSIARKALLDSDLTYNKKPMKCGLLISSLSTMSFGDTNSTRPIKGLVLPSKLNNTEIVEEIWNPKNKLKLSDEGKYRLGLIAATVNNLPRLVEIVNDFILNNPDSKNISSRYANKLYKALEADVRLRYSAIPYPSDRVLSAIVFDGGVRIGDTDTADSILNSVITNSLPNFRDFDTLGGIESSMVMLWVTACIAKFDETTGLRVEEKKSRLLSAKIVKNGFERIINRLVTWRDEGEIWETCYYEWMMIRIRCAMNYDTPNMSIAKLLGIENAYHKSVLKNDADKYLYAPLSIYNSKKKMPTTLQNNSYQDPEYVRKAISEVEVCAKSPVVIIRPAKFESWDLCLKIFTGDKARPMHVFIENKSRKEEVREGKENLPRENEKQYRQTMKMMNFSHNGTLDALYIYMRTHNSTSVVKDNLIKIGREDSSRFMGPLSDLYYMSRSVTS